MLVYNLNNGDKFTRSFSISGGGGDDIVFWVIDPQGTTVLNLGGVSQGTTLEFTARVWSIYITLWQHLFIIHFKNGKLVL